MEWESLDQDEQIEVPLTHSISAGWNGPVAVMYRDCGSLTGVPPEDMRRVRCIQELDTLKDWRTIIRVVSSRIRNPKHVLFCKDVSTAHARDSDIMQNQGYWSDGHDRHRECERRLYNSDILWMNEDRVFGLAYAVMHAMKAKFQPKSHHSNGAKLSRNERVAYWVMMSGYTPALQWLIHCGLRVADVFDQMNEPEHAKVKLTLSCAQTKSMLQFLEQELNEKFQPIPRYKFNELSFSQIKFLMSAGLFVEKPAECNLNPKRMEDDEIMELVDQGFPFPSMLVKCLTSTTYPRCMAKMIPLIREEVKNPNIYERSQLPQERYERYSFHDPLQGINWLPSQAGLLLEAGVDTSVISMLPIRNKDHVSFVCRAQIRPSLSRMVEVCTRWDRSMALDILNYFQGFSDACWMHQLLSVLFTEYCDKYNNKQGQESRFFQAAAWLVQQGADISYDGYALHRHIKGHRYGARRFWVRLVAPPKPAVKRKRKPKAEPVAEKRARVV